MATPNNKAEVEGEFRGTSRFRIVKQLGMGGMGVVYEAFDVETNQRIALKTLRSMSPETLLMFKQEFRIFQDIEHKNLAHLGELFEHEGHWFFTMELVEGVNLLEHIQGKGGAPPSHVPRLAVVTADSGEMTSFGVLLNEPVSEKIPELEVLRADPKTGVAAGEQRRFVEHRLRNSLMQLADALDAVHSAQKVHRDVKPGNVVVTDDNRVVLLDFGLASEAGWGEETDGTVLGTVTYMAPEQAAGLWVGPPRRLLRTGCDAFSVPDRKASVPGDAAVGLHTKAEE